MQQGYYYGNQPGYGPQPAYGSPIPNPHLNI